MPRIGLKIHPLIFSSAIGITPQVIFGSKKKTLITLMGESVYLAVWLCKQSLQLIG